MYSCVSCNTVHTYSHSCNTDYYATVITVFICELLWQMTIGLTGDVWDTDFGSSLNGLAIDHCEWTEDHQLARS